MQTTDITSADYSDLPADFAPTATPAQAHAIICAGGIQPWSITPEAAKAILTANKAATIRARRAHGLPDDHRPPPPAPRHATTVRIAVPHNPTTEDIIRAVKKAQAHEPAQVIFYQPSGSPASWTQQNPTKQFTRLDKTTSRRLSACAACLKASNSPASPSFTSPLAAAQSAVASLPATCRPYASEFAILFERPAPAIPLGQAIALGVEAQEAVLLARQSVQPEGAAPASTISREVWAKAFPNNPLP